MTALIPESSVAFAVPIDCKMVHIDQFNKPKKASESASHVDNISSNYESKFEENLAETPIALEEFKLDSLVRVTSGGT